MRDENPKKRRRAEAANGEAKDGEEATPEGGGKSIFREYLEALLIAAIFLGFTNTFVVKTFFIPSASMEETLLVGDHLFVNRYVYGPAATGVERALLPQRPVNRGDVVIFRSPEEPETDLVKRCVAIGGDRVEIIEKELYVNGEHVDDDAYTQHTDPRTLPNHPWIQRQQRQRDNFGPLTVPEDHVFCLGDNRDASYDSRFWGPVPSHLIKGRALVIYWSNGSRGAYAPQDGQGGRIAQLLRTMAGLLTNTRWERTFLIIR